MHLDADYLLLSYQAGSELPEDLAIKMLLFRIILNSLDFLRMTRNFIRITFENMKVALDVDGSHHVCLHYHDADRRDGSGG